MVWHNFTTGESVPKQSKRLSLAKRGIYERHDSFLSTRSSVLPSAPGHWSQVSSDSSHPFRQDQPLRKSQVGATRNSTKSRYEYCSDFVYGCSARCDFIVDSDLSVSSVWFPTTAYAQPAPAPPLGSVVGGGDTLRDLRDTTFVLGSTWLAPRPLTRCAKARRCSKPRSLLLLQ